MLLALTKIQFAGLGHISEAAIDNPEIGLTINNIKQCSLCIIML